MANAPRFLVRTSSPVAAPPTYYVRTDGNNANTGLANTAGGAWRTIDYAADHVTAGDLVRVQAGTYVEVATPGVNGTLGSPITLLADGVVTTCGFSFVAKSYIRVIGFTIDPSTGGCSSSVGILGSGANTGLEFWNNAIANTGANNGIAFDGGAGSPVTCDKCIILGGSLDTIGTGSQTAIRLSGDDDFVGYVNFTTIKYLGVGPAGARGRFVNLNFSGLVQVGASHPDFFYIATDAKGFSNNLMESIYGIGTITSTDNKFFHAQNESAAAWNDDVWRQNVAYNMGSGFFSLYDTTNALTNWRFYGNTIVNCDRANNSAPFDNCGNISAQGGHGVSASIFNNILYQAWADVVTTNIIGWGESGSPTVTKNYNLAFDPQGSVTFTTPWTSQVNPQSNVDPSFVNAASDFTLQSGSGARGVGGPLTTATSCSGTTLNVATNTGSFFIGSNAANLTQYGGALVPGDVITVNATNYTVSSVAASALTLTASITCSNGDAIYYGSSATIDIGAYPYKSGGYTLSATYATVGGTVTITPNDTSLVRFIVAYSDGVPYAVMNASPYTCSTAWGTFSAKAYPMYAGTTQSVAATAA